MIFPNGITFPKRCGLCPRPAENLRQDRCRSHWEIPKLPSNVIPFLRKEKKP